MKTSKIRIFHFIYALKGGGAEKQLKYLLNTMDPDRFVNAVCCGNSEETDDLATGVEIFEIPRKFRFDLRWRQIFKCIKSWRPDIIHNWLPNGLWPSLIPSWFSGIPCYVASYRNYYKINRLQDAIEAVGFCLSNRIVSNSGAMGFPYKNIFALKKGVVIPNGVDLAHIGCLKSFDISRLGIDNQKPVILYAGRLVEHKNIQTLLNAVSLLKDEGIAITLLLCGTGNYSNNLQQISHKLGIKNQVLFAGYRDDVVRIMKSCDMLVLPSFYEGMPNVIFEAMAAGIPVIASDIKAHNKWITHKKTGLLFCPNDHQDLVDNIKQILNEPETTKEKCLAAARSIVNKLSLTKMAETYDFFYNDCLKTAH